LSTDNWIGSLPQANGSMDDWPGFYRTRRLEPQLGRARSAGLIRGNLSKACDALLDRLEDFFPQSGDRPALLHGDLWSGNYLVGPNREPCLVDPAVYYGHPAIDLAMTRLFGGFDTYFYSAYRELRPERPGDAEREELCRLYPLLVHVNLFGAGYVSSVEGIVRRFV
jgi:fructosamine-3-kinase